MAKNLLNNYLELSKEDKESLLKVLREDLGNINMPKIFKKYDEVTISGDKYFILDIKEGKTTLCMSDIMSEEDIEKYFTDKWYLDGNCDVRFNSNVRNNRYEDSYIYTVLNGKFREDKLKGLNIIGDVRLLTKEQFESLDMEHRKSSRYGYWLETPYNNMEDLEYGQYANVRNVYSDGKLNYDYSVAGTCGVRPVITLSTETLLGL